MTMRRVWTPVWNEEVEWDWGACSEGQALLRKHRYPSLTNGMDQGAVLLRTDNFIAVSLTWSRLFYSSTALSLKSRQLGAFMSPTRRPGSANIPTWHHWQCILWTPTFTFIVSLLQIYQLPEVIQYPNNSQKLFHNLWKSPYPLSHFHFYNDT